MNRKIKKYLDEIDKTEKKIEELTAALPNTHIEFDAGFTTGNGWRQLQNYFDMRELMGLPTNAW